VLVRLAVTVTTTFKVYFLNLFFSPLKNTTYLVAEHLLSMCETLSLIPSTSKNKPKTNCILIIENLGKKKKFKNDHPQS
jgi:hypothetical protein